MKYNMPELHYRASRIYRALGNPTAYSILRIIGRGKRRPSELMDLLKLSLPTICVCLRNLRNLDLIRYDNLRQGKIYYIKDRAVLDLLERTEALVGKIQQADY